LKMNKNWSFVPSIFLCIIFLFGCATTMSEVNLNYHAPEEIVSAFQSPLSAAIRIGTVSDKRGYENPRLLVHKQNMHRDTTKGGYLAEKPISIVLEDALKEALTKANFNIDSEKTVFELNGELLDFDIDSAYGFKSRITMTLSLTSMTSQKIVWSKTFVGRAIVTKEPWLENSFELALDDLIKKVVASKSLAAELKD
jgi:hypothetical protein